MKGKAKQREMQALRAAGMTLASAERMTQTKRGSTVALVAIGGLAVITMAGVGVLSLNLPGAATTPQLVDVAPDPIPTRMPEIAPEIELVENAATDPMETAVESTVIAQQDAETLPWVVALETSNAQVEAPIQAAIATEVDCVSDLASDVSGVLVQFAPGSAVIPPDSFDRISVVGRLTNACPEARVQVAGHSDSSGSDLANLQLSWTRAENTIEALSLLGFDTRQFETVGFGSRAPLQQGSSGEDGINRRVEIRVLKGETK
ncbi:MAG: OmpA family protein [Tateyamaria sp.]